MKYRVNHITTYSGNEPISVGHNQAWLQPRNLSYQVCEEFNLTVQPQPSVHTSRLDSFGNSVATFSFNEGYGLLRVHAASQVQVLPRWSSLPDSPSWQTLSAQLRRPQFPLEIQAFEALPFVFDSPHAFASPEAGEFFESSFAQHESVSAAAADLMQRIHADFRFDPQATTISTPVIQVMQERRGVCQDFAHVMLSVLRSKGLAARYVSGYIRTIPRAGQARLVGADASHAWISVYCGAETGWLDLDPTNNCLVGEDHITVAWGRDYGDIPPLRGVFVGGGQPHLEVSVDVEALD